MSIVSPVRMLVLGDGAIRTTRVTWSPPPSTRKHLNHLYPPTHDGTHHALTNSRWVAGVTLGVSFCWVALWKWVGNQSSAGGYTVSDAEKRL